jgi:hypothetical protein
MHSTVSVAPVPVPTGPHGGGAPLASLAEWTAVVRSQLPHLTPAVATVLALWSFGMVVAQSCGLTTVACTVAQLLGKKEAATRQQLREWCYDKEDKRGRQRQDWDVSTCFGPLLAWVLTWWDPAERRLALAMDATTLGQRFTVLVISVVYRGCAIPVAWKVIPATAPGTWRPHWEALFTQLRGTVPADWAVLVCADRGLYAPWLYRHIVAAGWHPFLRINGGGLVRVEGHVRWRSLHSVVPQPGYGWRGRVTCFKGQPLACTLLARWDAPHTEPWLILTDLDPAVAEACWYSLRPAIECGFKDMKRGGWHWEQTKMIDPARASRLWLAIAVATLWVLSAAQAEAEPAAASGLPALPGLMAASSRSTRRSRPRALSVFRRGLVTILVALIKGDGLVLGRLSPEDWPQGTRVQSITLSDDPEPPAQAAA